MTKCIKFWGAPGTGKTTRLIQEINSLLEKGYRKDEFVITTFRKAMSDEIRSRLRWGDEGTVSTLHAACRKFAGVNGKVVKDKEMADFCKAVGLTFDTRGSSEEYDFDSISSDNYRSGNLFFDTWHYLQNNLLEISQLPLCPDYMTLEKHVPHPVAFITSYSEKYRQWKENYGYVDYDDMLMSAYRGNIIPPARVLVVDEFQDLTPLQYAITRLWETSMDYVLIAGDPRQCVVEGTKILTEHGEVRVENIRSNHNISSGTGNNRIGISKVKEVFRRHVEDQPVLTITTRTGQKVTTTPEHIHFAGYDNHVKGDWYYVYLMYGHRLGYRIGITSKTRNDGYEAYGFKSRLGQERADRLWLLEVCDTVYEAKYYEQLYSVRYGLPTWVFYIDNRLCLRRGRPGYRDEEIKKLFSNINTEQSALALLSSKGILIDYPHHVPKCMNSKRRRNFSITMCGDGRDRDSGNRKRKPCHIYAISGSDMNDALLLKNIGLNVRPSKKGKGWKVEGTSAQLSDIYEILKKVRAVMDVNVIEKARLGTRSLPFTPAGNVLPKMSIFISNKGKIMLDEVVSVERGTYKGDVYDLNVERYHNYIANGIAVHNCVYSFWGASASFFEKHEGEQVTLKKSYRLPAPIWKFATAILDQVGLSYPDIETSGKPGFVEKIIESVYYERMGAPAFQSNTKHLVRTNQKGVTVAHALADAGVPFVGIAGWKKNQIDFFNAIIKVRRAMAGESVVLSATELEEVIDAYPAKHFALKKTRLKQLLENTKQFKFEDIKHWATLDIFGRRTLWHIITSDAVLSEALKEYQDPESLKHNKIIRALKKYGREIGNITVAVSTIHSAKGSEAQIVFLHDSITKRIWKKLIRYSDPIARAEEAQLFYVGASRALQFLFIVEGKGKYRYALPAIKEMI